jgi:cardiolipin synthase (CMP-forming)
MTLRFLPNLLCVLRMLLVYPVAHGILVGHYPQVLAVFAVAAATDGLDGFLAKRFAWTSDLGKHLDPLADKLLLTTVFVCLSLAKLAPWWLTATVLLRDLLIVSGAIAYRVLLGQIHGQPTPQSKLNTFCQIVFCLAVVAEAAYEWPGEAVIAVCGALAFVTTAVSGLDYVLVYSRRAISAARATSTG